MRKFKLFTAALTLFISFVSINLNAQFSTNPPGLTFGSGIVRCPYIIKGEFEGEGIGNISISVSTGLSIPPITLFTNGFFVQPIGVLFQAGDPEPVTVTITSITTNGSSQSGISLKVNSSIVCQPNSTAQVEFRYDLSKTNGCPVFH